MNSPPPSAGAAAGCCGADELPSLPGPNSVLPLGAGDGADLYLGELDTTVVRRTLSLTCLTALLVLDARRTTTT